MSDQTIPQPPDGGLSGAHPTPETLADHAEGLLPPGQAGPVAAHLLGCVECRDVHDALAEVSTLLTAYADPGPVPADVADRLEAALERESRQRPVPLGEEGEEASASAAGSSGAATVVPDTASRPRARTPWSSRLLQAAAVIVLLAAVTAVGLSAFVGGRSGDGRTGGAADSAARAEQGRPPASGATRTRLSETGAAYTQANLAALGRALALGDLATFAAPGNEATGGGVAPGPHELSRNADRRLVAQPAALSACVAQLAGRPVTPVAVDAGTWAGSPATVIVLPAEGDPAILDVFAVKPSCPPGLFLGYARIQR